MRRAILAAAILCVSVFQIAAAEAAVPIRPSSPLKGGQGLGTRAYAPLEDEEPFLKKITEKEINLWEQVQLPKPSNISKEEWEKMEKEQLEERKKQIPVREYELKKQVKEYVGWFGIVRSMSYSEKKKQTQLRVEHKYFDGMTDLHLHVVSYYGAGDFQVILPGQVTKKEIPPLGLICVYGNVANMDSAPTVKAEYVRVWDWGLFTFMDYGKDKSNPDWVKLRKVAGEDAYSPRPTNRFYIERLGKRDGVEAK